MLVWDRCPYSLSDCLGYLANTLKITVDNTSPLDTLILCTIAWVLVANYSKPYGDVFSHADKAEIG